MISDFVARIRHEATLSATGVRESLVSVAERVNRKVQIMKLHAHCSSLEDQVNAHYVNLGAVLAEHLPSEPSARRSLFFAPDTTPVAPRLASTLTQVLRLRRELQRLTSAITEIETETLTDTLMRMHRDLSTRGAAVERLVIQPRSAAAGLVAREFETSTQARVIAVCRGPALLTSCEQLALAPGDVLFLLGLRAQLRAAAQLTDHPQRVTAV